MKAIKVKALPGYKLYVSFDDGTSGEVLLKDFVEEGIFSVLKNEEKFSNVYLTEYAIAWNDDLEIDLLTVYAELAATVPETLFNSSVHHATN